MSTESVPREVLMKLQSPNCIVLGVKLGGNEILDVRMRN